MSWAVYPFSGKSLFAGVVNTVATVFTQKALMRTLGKVSLPVFTLPFTLSTLLLVLSWNKQGQKWRNNDNKDRILANNDDKDRILASNQETVGC